MDHAHDSNAFTTLFILMFFAAAAVFLVHAV